MPSIDRDRWRRLEELFAQASDLPPGERQAFIDRETTGDADLHRDLTGMLAHLSDGGLRIVSAIGAVAGSLPESSSWIGRRLGSYRIIREIGRGGMGLVFEAVRDDDEYRKTVAIKVAPPWTNATAVRERFRLERQILAELEHPNIARFLDGGTDDGVPYFVMEYVDGRPITEYCDRHSLDLLARLALFRQVCGAVRFAHESLVVHRDLKPSNILVAESGVPKLLDFGIAKLLDPFVGDEATATFEMRWTPDYATPEQLSGRAITTRTDVYQLGLVLYELLTGTRAQVADSSSPVTLERSICETEPLRPSERAVNRFGQAWANRLRGDLDTIVMTAIRKEPEQRYGTVAAFSDDLERYLTGQPVHARPSTVIYRAGKFLRRHRVGAAAVVVVLVSLVGGLSAAVYQARRADHRYQQVRALANTFVFDVYDRIEQLSGATEARKVVVQTALTYLESLRPDAAGDAGLARELSAAYVRVGDAQGSALMANLGDTPGALASYTRALELLTPLVERGDRQAQRQFVRAKTAVADLQSDSGERKEAVASYARAEAVGDALVVEGPVDVELLTSLSGTYASDARLAVRMADFPRAEKASRRTIELNSRALAIDPSNLAAREDLGGTYNTLGQTLHQTGRLREAADLFQKAVDIREEIAKTKPDDAMTRRNLIVSYGNLSDVLGAQMWTSLQDVDGAIAAIEKATALAEAGRQKDPVDRRGWFDVVNARYRLGLLLAQKPDRIDSAVENFEEAGRLMNDLRSGDPKRFVYEQFATLLEWRTGQALEKSGRRADAAKRYESARSIAAVWLKGPTANLGITYARSTASLATFAAQAGDRRAQALADQAAQVLASLSPGPVPTDAQTYHEVGAAYLEVARRSTADRPEALKAAARHLEKSAALLRDFKPPAEVEPLRLKELQEIEAQIAECQRLSQ